MGLCRRPKSINSTIIHFDISNYCYPQLANAEHRVNLSSQFRHLFNTTFGAAFRHFPVSFAVSKSTKRWREESGSVSAHLSLGLIYSMEWNLFPAVRGKELYCRVWFRNECQRCLSSSCLPCSPSLDSVSLRPSVSLARTEVCAVTALLSLAAVEASSLMSKGPPTPASVEEGGQTWSICWQTVRHVKDHFYFSLAACFWL